MIYFIYLTHSLKCLNETNWEAAEKNKSLQLQLKNKLPELRLELSEVRPLAGVVRPALCHQAVEGGWALGGHGQPLAVLYPADDVVVLDALEGLDAEHQDLPHAHACAQNGNREPVTAGPGGRRTV